MSPDEMGQDPSDRMYRGMEFARQGKYEEALREYVWCYDFGRPLRSSFLLGYWTTLGECYPPAKAALSQRRDMGERSLLRGDSDVNTAFAFATINHFMREGERTLAVFDRLSDGSAQQNQIRKALLRFVARRLLDEKRFGAILSVVGNVEEDLAWSIDCERKFKDYGRTSHALARHEQIDMTSQIVTGQFGPYYEALLGAGELSVADRVANRIMEEFPADAQTYLSLRRHAVRAGQLDRARAILVRGLAVAPDAARELLLKPDDQPDPDVWR